ncbi:glycoside hydrolase family 130 protein [Flavobacterium cutihirudinis]|nr:hypothetical protein [Flavobacterium cutihirudinis]
MEAAIKHAVILEKTGRNFEELFVANPAIYQDGNNIRMYYRAAKKRNYTLTATIKKNLYVWNKNVVFFPKKINGKFIALHRLFSSIQIVSFEKKAELTKAFWKAHLKNLPDHIIIKPKYDHKTDINYPVKAITRLPKPLIAPAEYYERPGYVNYVVSSTGTAIFDDLLYIYYGTADNKICGCPGKLKRLIN